VGGDDGGSAQYKSNRNVTTSPLYNEYIVIQIKIINETLFLVGQSQLNLSVA
jgi:hypothetical protein